LFESGLEGGSRGTFEEKSKSIGGGGGEGTSGEPTEVGAFPRGVRRRVGSPELKTARKKLRAARRPQTLGKSLPGATEKKRALVNDRASC